MNTYESIVIFTDDLLEKDYNKIVSYYEHKIMASGGKLKTTDKLGKKKLAYKIKDKYEYGWYVVFRYKAPAEFTHTFEKLLKIDDNVIKFMTLKCDDDDDDYDYIPDDKESESEQPEAKIIIKDFWEEIFGGV